MTSNCDTLYQDGRFTADEWVHLAPGEPRLPGRDCVFALSDFLALDAGHDARCGVRIEAAEDILQLTGRCGHLALIVIVFPGFTDGRGYSNARLARERLGFCGEVRAVGDVLIDQLAFMQRCGIDSFDIQNGTMRARLNKASPPDVTLYLQPSPASRLDAAQNNEEPFWRRRAAVPVHARNSENLPGCAVDDDGR